MAKPYKPSEGTRAALAVVQVIRSSIPGWRRSLDAALGEAGDQTPDFEKLRSLLTDPGKPEIEAAAETIDDGASLVGQHAELLRHALKDAAKWWGTAADAVKSDEIAPVTAAVQAADEALSRAMQHVLLLTFAFDVFKSHVGEQRGIDSYCSDWGLTSDAVDQLWAWLQQDDPEFDGHELPIALDTINRCAYRTTESFPVRVLTASAPLIGIPVVFGSVAGLFELLHAAAITTWPGLWVWKLLVLLVFTSLGALGHVGTAVLNVNYGDPMKVYDAGGVLEWLSLRWLAVFKLYIPVAFVVASLWGAGNIPSSFHQLGTALLAGYSADSLFGAALSKLRSQK